jgi:hypothetical protein
LRRIWRWLEWRGKIHDDFYLCFDTGLDAVGWEIWEKYGETKDGHFIDELERKTPYPEQISFGGLMTMPAGPSDGVWGCSANGEASRMKGEAGTLGGAVERACSDVEGWTMSLTTRSPDMIDDISYISRVLERWSDRQGIVGNIDIRLHERIRELIEEKRRRRCS